MAAFDEANLNPAIILDCGSSILRAGVAGEDTPSVEFPNMVGRPKYPIVMLGDTSESDLFVGNNAVKNRGILSLKHPISRGVIEHWSDMENVWLQMYHELNRSPEKHKVLISEKPLSPLKNREKIAEIFFENFNIPGIHFVDEAPLILYSAGRSLGVVLSCGDGVSFVSPIYQNFSIFHGINRMEIGGIDITHFLTLLLRRSGVTFHTTAEIDAVKHIKEEICYLPLNSAANELLKLTKDIRQTERPVHLPDGSEIYVGSEKYVAPEILFKPSLIGLEFPGIHELVTNSLARCDTDIRHTLYSSIIVAGGSTLLSGFCDRLINEMRKSIPKNMKIRIQAPPERIHTVWMGGSILASLSAFKSCWVSRQEYNDDPKEALNKMRW